MIQKTYQVAEVQVSYNPKFKAQDRPKINSSKQAYNILINQWDKNKIELLEQFKMILLNSNNRVLGIAEISQGGVSATVVDPKIIFGIALKANASSIIIAHNHPSGNLYPSSQDTKVTEKLVQCGKILEISVEDHIILSNDNYYSFADNCLI